MRINRGIYNNHGHVGIRVFPYGDTTPYYEHGFGCWCQPHIALAEKRLRILRDDIESGKFKKNQEQRRVLFSEAWDLFFKKHYLEEERTQSTICNAQSCGKQFKKLWPTVYIDEFTPRHIKEDYVLPHSDAKGGTIRNRLSMLQVMFSKLTKWSQLKEIENIKLPEFNPAESITKPSGKYVGRKHLEVGEIKRFKDWCLENCPDLWVAAYSASWSTLRHRDMIKMSQTQSLQGVASKTGKVFVLPGAVPTAANIKGFQNIWKKARIACGIEWFHWHWWRAMGAKIMRMQNIPEATVQQILQHSTVQQTREYTGDSEYAAAAVEKVKDFLDAL